VTKRNCDGKINIRFENQIIYFDRKSATYKIWSCSKCISKIEQQFTNIYKFLKTICIYQVLYQIRFVIFVLYLYFYILSFP